jgi:hypothetical protein
MIFLRLARSLADKRLTSALAVDPHSPDAHYEMGLLKQNQGDWAGSVQEKEDMDRRLRQITTFIVDVRQGFGCNTDINDRQQAEELPKRGSTRRRAKALPAGNLYLSAKSRSFSDARAGLGVFATVR